MNDIDFLVGQAVAEIRDDNRIVFVTGTRPEPDLYADVGECVCVGAAGNPLQLADLVQRSVSAASTPDGVLTLTFTDGALLRCSPDPKYEAWQVVGGSPQYLVVCLAGGELAVWDKRHVPSHAEAEEMVEQLQGLFGWSVRVKEVTDEGGIIAEPEDGNGETNL